MKKTLIYTVLASTLALSLGVAATASAETSVGVSATSNVNVDGQRPGAIGGILKDLKGKQEHREGPGEREDSERKNLPINATTNLRANAQLNASSSAAIIAQAKARAIAEIDKRIEAMNSFSTRIDGMKKLSDSQKATTKAEIQAEITKLNTLKAKISADTDTAVLKTDIQSINSSLRIYALVMPQMAVLASAERVQNLIDDFVTVAAKLQARIDAARAAGVNVTAYVTSLAEVNTKIASAKVDVAAAISLVSSLTADNGDKAKAEANIAALKAGKEKVKSATNTLKGAKETIKSIVKGTKIKTPVSASSTADVR